MSLGKNLFQFSSFLSIIKKKSGDLWCFDTWLCFPNTKTAEDSFWVQVAYQPGAVKACLYFVAKSTQGSNMAGTTSVCLFFFPA